jgi:hypothetical protein
MAGGGRQTVSGGALTKSKGMAGPQDVCGAAPFDLSSPTPRAAVSRLLGTVFQYHQMIKAIRTVLVERG